MLKTFARSKTKSQRMHARKGRLMQRNCFCTVSLSGYLCKMPKWHQDTQTSKEKHYDKDKLKRAKTKSQRMHAYIWTAMCAWWSCSWRMRNRTSLRLPLQNCQPTSRHGKWGKREDYEKRAYETENKIWLATSAKYGSQGAHEDRKIKIKLSGQKHH
jgi:hypothetical protein